MSEIRLGDTIRFVPSAWSDADKTDGGRPRPKWMQTPNVEGEVEFINTAHGWYRVRYVVRSHCGTEWVGHECFPIPVPPSEPEPHGMYNSPSHKGASKDFLSYAR